MCLVSLILAQPTYRAHSFINNFNESLLCARHCPIFARISAKDKTKISWPLWILYFIPGTK